jgi:hypothetical protein
MAEIGRSDPTDSSSTDAAHLDEVLESEFRELHGGDLASMVPRLWARTRMIATRQLWRASARRILALRVHEEGVPIEGIPRRAGGRGWYLDR